MNIAVCIPTFDAASTARLLLDALAVQSITDFERLIVDSESLDGTVSVFSSAGFRVHSLPPTEFDHGAVRRLATELNPDADILVFMTQDAIPASADSLERLTEVFADPLVGAAYGRQLPGAGATPIAAHARFFNYAPDSRMKTSSDVPRLGLKTVFISDSFAAYRRTFLEAVGGFPERCIVSEDTYVAARLLLAGWKIAYCAEAQVYHSHNYNWRQEFQRYFDIGVFHAREPWIRKAFGGAEGEGRRFIRSEMKFLLLRAPHLLPSAIVRTAVKYLGFRAGLAERCLPLGLKRTLSAQKAFWMQEGKSGDAARAVEAD